MVRHSNGRAASLLDSAGPGTSRPPDSATVSLGGEDDADDAFVVRVHLCEGPFELRVPRASVKARHHRHAKGSNACPTSAERRRGSKR
jgi:hypothetical protein